MRKRGHVIFLIHGIRTQGEWATRAAKILESDPTIRVRPIRYEFLDVIRFLIPLSRFRNTAVRRVTRLIRDELSRKPNALSIIAHSFGSYIIGKILENETDIKFHRLILCGSIIPDNFSWGRFGHRLHSDSEDSWQVINECGMQDIWPVIAKSITWGYGSSGRFGFGHPRVKDRFYNIGHSGFFDEEFVRKRWLPYFVSGEITPSVLNRPTTPWWLSILTVFKIRYLALSIILFAFWITISEQTYIQKRSTLTNSDRNHTKTKNKDESILLRSQKIKVLANNESWTSSKITLTKGQHIRITASGFARNDPNPFFKDLPPDGYGRPDPSSHVPAPGMNKLSLAGKIGSTFFNVGDSYNGPSPDNGILFFIYNDSIGGFGNNSGEFEVTIEY